MKNDTQRIIDYCISTFKIMMVSDQYYFYFYFCDIGQKSYIMCYCPLTYDDNIILVMFYIKISCITVHLTNLESVISWDFVSQFIKPIKE